MVLNYILFGCLSGLDQNFTEIYPDNSNCFTFPFRVRVTGFYCMSLKFSSTFWHPLKFSELPMQPKLVAKNIGRIGLGLNSQFPASIECFHSRGQHLCKFIGTKENVCIRKEFNSHRIGLGHQHGRHFIVLGHQYGRRDVMWKHYIEPITCEMSHRPKTELFSLEMSLWSE